MRKNFADTAKLYDPWRQLPFLPGYEIELCVSVVFTEKKNIKGKVCCFKYRYLCKIVLEIYFDIGNFLLHVQV